MEKMNPNQNYLNDMETLWRLQPVPNIPNPPGERMIPLRFVASIAAMVLWGTVSFSVVPASDIAAINYSSLFRYAEVNTSLSQILPQQ